MEWEKASLDGDEVRSFARRYGLDLLVSTVLLRRGRSSGEDIRFFLEDDLQFLHNPFLFIEMEEAVDRINAAIEGEEGLFVYGDRDVDGITSTALAVRALREMGARVDWAVPLGDDSYGLTESVVAEVKQKGSGLIITVDCGISNAAEIQMAKDLGIDTIVVDHHNPQDDIPHAVAVLNPKIEDSGYPFASLSACGIVFKLIWALFFSRTALYGRTVNLLNIHPLNEAFVLEAVKLENLVEVDRLRENVVPRMLKWTESRLSEFIGDGDTYVYDAELQRKQLAKAFQEEPRPTMLDLASEMDAWSPELSGKSLLQIREMRNIGRYTGKMPEEVDVAVELFRSMILQREGLLGERLIQRLDLVALSTLADIMPLADENRILVRRGLLVINTAGREPIRELLFRKGLMKKTITTRDVAWQISPIINASGRMGEPNRAVELFLAESSADVERLAGHIVDLNKKRRKMEEGIWDTILRDAKSRYRESGEKFIVVTGEEIHRGITGLLASRLLAIFRVPAVVVSLMQDKATGSLRCPQRFDMEGFFAGFDGIFSDFGGHDRAAGFTLPIEKMPDFEAKIDTVLGGLKPVRLEEKVLTIDAEVPTSYLSPDLFRVVELFEPYGEGNPPLIFLTKGMRIESCDLIGRKQAVHLKMLLNSGKYKWPAVYWNGSERWNRDFTLYDTIDVVYQLSKSSYNNTETLQLSIQDARK